MDITVYLPDELGAEAKAAGLNFSALLRASVIEELETMKAVEQTLSDAKEYIIRIENKDGYGYSGRFQGALIAEDRYQEVYLTDDERVLLYDGETLRVRELDDPEEQLRDSLGEEAYIQAMDALGLEAVVDI